jgi:hypothetical protein
MPRTIRRMKWYAAALAVVGVAAVPTGVAIAQSSSGPSLHSSHSGSGAGTRSGPNGPFIPSTGSAPPAAPAGSTTYASNGSGSGKVVKSIRPKVDASVRGAALVAAPQNREPSLVFMSRSIALTQHACAGG